MIMPNRFVHSFLVISIINVLTSFIVPCFQVLNSFSRVGLSLTSKCVRESLDKYSEDFDKEMFQMKKDAEVSFLN